MKRSVAISLALLGSGIALSGCEEKSVDTAAYANPEQCIAAGKFSKDDCLSDYQTAVSDHQKTAPAFASQRDCEFEFGDGKCQQASPLHPAGLLTYTPFMMGYIMGDNSSSSRYSAAPQALYSPKRSDSFVNGSGTPVTKNLGSFTLKGTGSTFSAPLPSSKTFARGAFSALSSSSNTTARGLFSSPSSSSRAISRGGFGGRSSFGGSFGG